MESGKSFFTRVERETEEREAILKAREEAENVGKPFGVLDEEIARLKAKREKLAARWKAPDAPMLKELDAQIARLKEEK